MTTDAPGGVDTDVLVVGAGPVGLTLANLLGGYDQHTIVLEERDELIDHPRGVGLDDESLRTMQTLGLVEEVRRHTVPHHVARLVNGRGQVLVENDPGTEEFGWPRKHGFVQPLVDRELLAGLDRYPHTTVRFSHRLVGITRHADHVAAEVETGMGRHTLRARYLVGAEGGRSFTREWMGAEFEGASPSTRWLVVDVRNDPVGTPGVYLGADPRRPYVSIGLPHAIRRWEFMLLDEEGGEEVEDPAFRRRMLRDHVPDPDALDVIGQRVFTHHGRIATSFREGRVLIAGDAAHLMPVWLGQGWNSGIRDATNLAWKLTAVLTGRCSDTLLDTYDTERRDHAQAMIDVNMTVGSIMKCGPVAGRVRDLVARGLGHFPAVKSYFTELRFKPMPRYARGVVVDQSERTPGRAALDLLSRAVPVVDAPASTSPVGTQFIQPRVHVHTARDALLDDVLGAGWTIACWGNNPARHLSAADLAAVRRHGMRLVAFVPETQREWAEKEYADSPVPVTVVGDAHGRIKRWFDPQPVSTLFLRPDRFVAGACLAQDTSATLGAVLTAMSVRTEDASDPTTTRPAEGAVR